MDESAGGRCGERCWQSQELDRPCTSQTSGKRLKRRSGTARADESSSHPISAANSSQTTVTIETSLKPAIHTCTCTKRLEASARRSEEDGRVKGEVHGLLGTYLEDDFLLARVCTFQKQYGFAGLCSMSLRPLTVLEAAEDHHCWTVLLMLLLSICTKTRRGEVHVLQDGQWLSISLLIYIFIKYKDVHMICFEASENVTCNRLTEGSK